MMVQRSKNVVREPNTVHASQPGNVLEHDQLRSECVRDTYHVLVEPILRVTGVAGSRGRIALARGARENCSRMETGRDPLEVFGSYLSDIGLEDRSSWVIRPVGLRGVTVMLHSDRNPPPRLAEAMAKTSSPRKEINSYWSVSFKSDTLLAYGAEGDKHACATPRPARANGPAVVDEVDVESPSYTWRDDRLVLIMRWLLLLRYQSKPTEDPRNMRVHGERVPVQRVGHDTPRGLLADTWKRYEECLYFVVSHLMEVLKGKIIIVAGRANAALAVIPQDCFEERLEVRSPLRLEPSGPQHALQFGWLGCSNVEPSGILVPEASEYTLVDGLASVQTEQDVHDLRENVIYVSQVSRSVSNLKEFVDASNSLCRIEPPQSTSAALMLVELAAGLSHPASSLGLAHWRLSIDNPDVACTPASGADRLRTRSLLGRSSERWAMQSARQPK